MTGLTAMAGVLAACLSASTALAHCDTMDGPVVKAAQRALAAKEVTPVLMWVQEKDETEVRSIFQRSLKVRELGADARRLADTAFFETVVRLHRAGEGEPYTGLKPAGAHPGDAVVAADRALETGSADALVREISQQVAAGIRGRFAAALDAKRGSEKSVEAGREFVRAYVEYMHHAEGIHAAAGGGKKHSEAGAVKTESAACGQHAGCGQPPR